MKLTYKWLLEHLNNLTMEEIKIALENLSIEIDSIIKIGGEGYVVGKIIDFKPYGEKLKICKVLYGEKGQLKEIICGAPNVILNMYTIVALENTLLPNGIILKSKNINGFLSSGMCLSYEEFGLKHLKSNGIINESEDFLKELIKEDYIINISIPANRVDISSIYGLANEIASYYNIPLKSLITNNNIGNYNPVIEIKCNSEIVSNYSSLEINNIKIKDNYNKIKSLLSKISDINPIPLVNIGNFITKDLGVPLHIYNKDSIKKLIIDLCKKQEKFLTLENQEIQLEFNDIVIKNENNETIVVGGLIGGEKYKINNNTENILIETGIFNKKYIIPTSNRLNINNESSYYFKRGINYNNYLLALNYFKNFLDGDYSKVNTIINNPKTIESIFLSYREFYEKTHQAISLESISNKLKTYKYSVKIFNKPTEDLNNEMGLIITPPLYKCHIDSSASIIEDIVRINGTTINKEIIKISLNDNLNNIHEVFYENILKLKEYLINMGLEEIITYSFSETGLIELVNPIVSNEKFLRGTLHNHMEKYMVNLIKNKTYMEKKYGAFEISKVFIKNEKIIEYSNLSIGLMKNTHHFGLNSMENYLKNILMNIGNIFNLKIGFVDGPLNKIHIYINNAYKGYIEFFNEYMILELENLESLIKKEIKTKIRVYEDIVEEHIRDYSFYSNLNYNEIEKNLYKIKNVSFCLLDIFYGKNQTSYTIRFKMKDSKEEDILNILNKLNVLFR